MAKETFLATTGLIGLKLLELHGIDAKRFAQQLGIGSTDVPSPKTRMAAELADKAFERAAQLIPDPAFALRAAECWHPSHIGPLEYDWLRQDELACPADIASGMLVYQPHQRPRIASIARFLDLANEIATDDQDPVHPTCRQRPITGYAQRIVAYADHEFPRPVSGQPAQNFQLEKYAHLRQFRSCHADNADQPAFLVDATSP